VHERNYEHDDHDHDQGRAGDAHGPLAPPELGVGPVTAVPTLGWRPDPVLVIVIGAHGGWASLNWVTTAGPALPICLPRPMIALLSRMRRTYAARARVSSPPRRRAAPGRHGGPGGRSRERGVRRRLDVPMDGRRLG
jgi:hypothetical protein